MNSHLCSYVPLFNRSDCCKISPVCEAVNRGQLSAPCLMPSPLEDVFLCLKKAENKDPHWVSRQVMQRHRAGRDNSQEMTLHNCRSTFTQPAKQPSGKQGAPTPKGKWEGNKNKALCGCCGIFKKERCGKQKTVPCRQTEGIEGTLPH